jgi:hypothetical protein
VAPVKYAGALLLALLACADEPRADRERGTTQDSTQATEDAPRAATDSAGDMFATRTAIFLLADSAELAYMRGEYGADFETVADDMMWYRAEALGFLERHEVPVVYFEGRRPLRFRVHGREQQHEFGDVEYADVVVLYEPDSLPRALPTIEVPTVAPWYFGLED